MPSAISSGLRKAKPGWSCQGVLLDGNLFNRNGIKSCHFKFFLNIPVKINFGKFFRQCAAGNKKNGSEKGRHLNWLAKTEQKEHPRVGWKPTKGPSPCWIWGQNPTKGPSPCWVRTGRKFFSGLRKGASMPSSPGGFRLLRDPNDCGGYPRDVPARR